MLIWKGQISKKNFYVTLQEEDGEYEGIIGIGLNEALTQYNERKKILKNGNFFEGEFKNDKIVGWWECLWRGF